MAFFLDSHQRKEITCKPVEQHSLGEGTTERIPFNSQPSVTNPLVVECRQGENVIEIDEPKPSQQAERTQIRKRITSTRGSRKNRMQFDTSENKSSQYIQQKSQVMSNAETEMKAHNMKHRVQISPSQSPQNRSTFSSPFNMFSKGPKFKRVKSGQQTTSGITSSQPHFVSGLSSAMMNKGGKGDALMIDKLIKTEAGQNEDQLKKERSAKSFEQSKKEEKGTSSGDAKRKTGGPNKWKSQTFFVGKGKAPRFGLKAAFVEGQAGSKQFEILDNQINTQNNTPDRHDIVVHEVQESASASKSKDTSAQPEMPQSLAGENLHASSELMAKSDKLKKILSIEQNLSINIEEENVNMRNAIATQEQPSQRNSFIGQDSLTARCSLQDYSVNPVAAGHLAPKIQENKAGQDTEEEDALDTTQKVKQLKPPGAAAKRKVSLKTRFSRGGKQTSRRRQSLEAEKQTAGFNESDINQFTAFNSKGSSSHSMGPGGQLNSLTTAQQVPPLKFESLPAQLRPNLPALPPSFNLPQFSPDMIPSELFSDSQFLLSQLPFPLSSDLNSQFMKINEAGEASESNVKILQHEHSLSRKLSSMAEGDLRNAGAQADSRILDHHHSDEAMNQQMMELLQFQQSKQFLEGMLVMNFITQQHKLKIDEPADKDTIIGNSLQGEQRKLFNDIAWSLVETERTLKPYSKVKKNKDFKKQYKAKLQKVLEQDLTSKVAKFNCKREECDDMQRFIEIWGDSMRKEDDPEKLKLQERYLKYMNSQNLWNMAQLIQKQRDILQRNHENKVLLWQYTNEFYQQRQQHERNNEIKSGLSPNHSLGGESTHNHTLMLPSSQRPNSAHNHVTVRTIEKPSEDQQMLKPEILVSQAASRQGSSRKVPQQSTQDIPQRSPPEEALAAIGGEAGQASIHPQKSLKSIHIPLQVHNQGAGQVGSGQDPTLLKCPDQNLEENRTSMRSTKQNLGLTLFRSSDGQGKPSQRSLTYRTKMKENSSFGGQGGSITSKQTIFRNSSQFKNSKSYQNIMNLKHKTQRKVNQTLSRNFSAKVDEAGFIPEVKGEGKKIYNMKSSRDSSIKQGDSSENSLSQYHRTDNKGTGVNEPELDDGLLPGEEEEEDEDVNIVTHLSTMAKTAGQKIHFLEVEQQLGLNKMDANMNMTLKGLPSENQTFANTIINSKHPPYTTREYFPKPTLGKKMRKIRPPPQVQEDSVVLKKSKLMQNRIHQNRTNQQNLKFLTRKSTKVVEEEEAFIPIVKGLVLERKKNDDSTIERIESTDLKPTTFNSANSKSRHRNHFFEMDMRHNPLSNFRQSRGKDKGLLNLELTMEKMGTMGNSGDQSLIDGLKPKARHSDDERAGGQDDQIPTSGFKQSTLKLSSTQKKLPRLNLDTVHDIEKSPPGEGLAHTLKLKAYQTTGQTHFRSGAKPNTIVKQQSLLIRGYGSPLNLQRPMGLDIGDDSATKKSFSKGHPRQKNDQSTRLMNSPGTTQKLMESHLVDQQIVNIEGKEIHGYPEHSKPASILPSGERSLEPNITKATQNRDSIKTFIIQTVGTEEKPEIVKATNHKVSKSIVGKDTKPKLVRGSLRMRLKSAERNSIKSENSKKQKLSIGSQQKPITQIRSRAEQSGRIKLYFDQVGQQSPRLPNNFQNNLFLYKKKQVVNSGHLLQRGRISATGNTSSDMKIRSNRSRSVYNVDLVETFDKKEDAKNKVSERKFLKQLQNFESKKEIDSDFHRSRSILHDGSLSKKRESRLQSSKKKGDSSKKRIQHQLDLEQKMKKLSRYHLDKDAKRELQQIPQILTSNVSQEKPTVVDPPKPTDNQSTPSPKHGHTTHRPEESKQNLEEQDLSEYSLNDRQVVENHTIQELTKEQVMDEDNTFSKYSNFDINNSLKHTYSKDVRSSAKKGGDPSFHPHFSMQYFPYDKFELGGNSSINNQSPINAPNKGSLQASSSPNHSILVKKLGVHPQGTSPTLEGVLAYPSLHSQPMTQAVKDGESECKESMFKRKLNLPLGSNVHSSSNSICQGEGNIRLEQVPYSEVGAESFQIMKNLNYTVNKSKQTQSPPPASVEKTTQSFNGSKNQQFETSTFWNQGLSPQQPGETTKKLDITRIPNAQPQTTSSRSGGPGSKMRKNTSQNRLQTGTSGQEPETTGFYKPIPSSTQQIIIHTSKRNTKMDQPARKNSLTISEFEKVVHKQVIGKRRQKKQEDLKRKRPTGNLKKGIRLCTARTNEATYRHAKKDSRFFMTAGTKVKYEEPKTFRDKKNSPKMFRFYQPTFHDGRPERITSTFSPPPQDSFLRSPPVLAEGSDSAKEKLQLQYQPITQHLASSCAHLPKASDNELISREFLENMPPQQSFQLKQGVLNQFITTNQSAPPLQTISSKSQAENTLQSNPGAGLILRNQYSAGQNSLKTKFSGKPLNLKQNLAQRAGRGIVVQQLVNNKPVPMDEGQISPAEEVYTAQTRLRDSQTDLIHSLNNPLTKGHTMNSSAAINVKSSANRLEKDLIPVGGSDDEYRNVMADLDDEEQPSPDKIVNNMFGDNSQAVLQFTLNQDIMEYIFEDSSEQKTRRHEEEDP